MRAGPGGIRLFRSPSGWEGLAPPPTPLANTSERLAPAAVTPARASRACSRVLIQAVFAYVG
jgi:hypothetical protein